MHNIFKDFVYLVGKNISTRTFVYSSMALKKIGISVDEKTLDAVKAEVETGDYRNVSHFFEKSAQLLLKERQKGKKPEPV